jgi:hypothetical protein
MGDGRTRDSGQAAIIEAKASARSIPIGCAWTVRQAVCRACIGDMETGDDNGAHEALGSGSEAWPNTYRQPCLVRT